MPNNGFTGRDDSDEFDYIGSSSERDNDRRSVARSGDTSSDDYDFEFFRRRKPEPGTYMYDVVTAASRPVRKEPTRTNQPDVRSADTHPSGNQANDRPKNARPSDGRKPGKPKHPVGSGGQGERRRIPAGTSPGGSGRIKPSTPESAEKKRKRQRSDIGAFAGYAALTVSEGARRFFSKRRNVIITLSALAAMLLIFLVSAGVRSIYSSKTLFADGGRDIDDASIEERLVTDEQNRDKVTYFLIVGVDKSSMLTDCIWMLCFDNQAHKMNVMQIPRDTFVGDDSKRPHKINSVYNNPQTVLWCEKCESIVSEDEVTSGKHNECGGKVVVRVEGNINALIRCINKRLKLPVDNYVLFDFEGFEKVIDAMDGVTIYLDEDLKVYPNKYEYEMLYKGVNHLDGAKALKFMRNRKSYAEGDIGRIKAQRKIIHAMLEKLDGMSASQALSVLKAAYGNFKTNMSLEEIRSFIQPVKNCGDKGLNMFEMPGTAKTVRGVSYYLCDEEQTAGLINEYMLPYSTKLTGEDIDFPDP